MVKDSGTVLKNLASTIYVLYKPILIWEKSNIFKAKVQKIAKYALKIWNFVENEEGEKIYIYTYLLICFDNKANLQTYLNVKIITTWIQKFYWGHKILEYLNICAHPWFSLNTAMCNI